MSNAFRFSEIFPLIFPFVQSNFHSRSQLFASIRSHQFVKFANLPPSALPLPWCYKPNGKIIQKVVETELRSDLNGSCKRCFRVRKTFFHCLNFNNLNCLFNSKTARVLIKSESNKVSLLSTTSLGFYTILQNSISSLQRSQAFLELKPFHANSNLL